MKKRWTAILMILMMSLALLAGCNDQSSNSRSSRNSRNDERETSDDSVEALSFNIFNTTEDFNEMMDAYKDFYNEFCEENLKPYYENRTECDCAAMLVVNPDNNKIMMVIADVVGFNSRSGGNVDLCFYEYSQGEVREYLKILNIWVDDTICVGNIADGLYVSYDHPNGNDWEYVHYKIENGEAKEITPTVYFDEETVYIDGQPVDIVHDGDEHTVDIDGHTLYYDYDGRVVFYDRQRVYDKGWWIDIDTNEGVYHPYFWHGSLTECIVTDATDANFCVSERLFEGYLDYLKEHTPESVTDLKVIYGDYLLENGATTRPRTFIVYDGIEYYYVREEKLFDNGRCILGDYDNYDRRFVNGTEPDMRGYLFPCVNDLLAHEYPESIDGYAVYPFDTAQLEEAAQIQAALSDANYQKYQRYFNNEEDDHVYRFVDIDVDGTPELLASLTYYGYTLFNIYEGSVCESYSVYDGRESLDYYNPNSGVIIFAGMYPINGGDSYSYVDNCYKLDQGILVYQGTVYCNGEAYWYNDNNYNDITITEEQYDEYERDIEENYIKVYELEYYSSIEEAWLAYNNLAYNNN